MLGKWYDGSFDLDKLSCQGKLRCLENLGRASAVEELDLMCLSWWQLQ